MRQTFRLSTIHGINIRVHVSFMLALLWVIYFWGIALDGGLRGVLFGIFVLVAVFVSVTGHELAHGFLAMRLGLKVEDITLLPIGGVARIESALLPPRQEVIIAVAGPFLNLLVAIGMTPAVVGVIITRDASDLVTLLPILQETTLSALILHLWLANVLLALFNLLPAFPMDGGRVLRALLSLHSSKITATRIAVALGQVIALLLLITGLYFRDFSLPLVAIFILIAAYIEARMIHLENRLRTLPVSQFALWDLGGVAPDAVLSHAARGGVRDVAVTTDGRVVGVIWRDVLQHSLSRATRLRAKDVMDRDVITMDVDSSVFDVHRRMLDADRMAMPITEGGIYRGMFTSERLIHVYRYLNTSKSSDRYRGFAQALGLIGRS